MFERNGRGVVLTDAGSRLLEHTRGILTQVGRARQELEEQRTGDSGHFALGLPPSLGRTITVPLVKAFSEQLPHLRLATVEGLSAYIIEWLNLGRVDCALVYNAAPSPAYDLQPLLEEQLFLVTPASDKAVRRQRRTVTLAELTQYPLIIPSRPHAMRMSVENAMATIDQKIRVVHEIESIPAIVDLVRQGHGYAVLPLNAVRSSPFASEGADETDTLPGAEDPLVDRDIGAAAQGHAAAARERDHPRGDPARNSRFGGETVSDPGRDYDDIPGTYVYDARRGRVGYALNMFCMSLNKAENRQAFKQDEAAYVDRFVLSPEQRRAVLARDWLGMLKVGRQHLLHHQDRVL